MQRDKKISREIKIELTNNENKLIYNRLIQTQSAIKPSLAQKQEFHRKMTSKYKNSPNNFLKGKNVKNNKFLVKK